MYVLCLQSDWFCRLTWLRVDICEKSLETCTCLWPEFDCPEVTLCGWQDIKIQLLLLLVLLLWLLLVLYLFHCSMDCTPSWKILWAASETLLVLQILRSGILFCLEVNSSIRLTTVCVKYLNSADCAWVFESWTVEERERERESESCRHCGKQIDFFLFLFKISFTHHWYDTAESGKVVDTCLFV